ncbi:MAG: hypothetical protein M3247_02470 [Thermoproteota archaeon]|nr:hypothetical protein [Thermoproteota archaeon]
MTQKGDDKTGTKCTVTSGPNKGKEGTYTVDEDGNTWCEGKWGGTECGSNKCSDARTAATQVFDYDVNGTNVQEVEGIFDVQGRGIFHGTVILDATTGKTLKTTAIRISPVSLGELRKSESEIEGRTAGALESYLRKQYG